MLIFVKIREHIKLHFTPLNVFASTTVNLFNIQATALAWREHLWHFQRVYVPIMSGTTFRRKHVSLLLARDSILSIANKLTLYKLCIRSILTYTVPVWCNTSSYNYRRLQISQSKCLPVIGNFPRLTPIPHLHTTLNATPIRDFIYHLTANFFDRCSAHPTPSSAP